MEADDLAVLARDARLGDERAFSRLVDALWPCIYRSARKWAKNAPRDALEVSGKIGLWKAVERWDGERPFLQFASSHVTGEIRHGERDERRLTGSSWNPQTILTLGTLDGVADENPARLSPALVVQPFDVLFL